MQGTVVARKLSEGMVVANDTADSPQDALGYAYGQPR